MFGKFYRNQFGINLNENNFIVNSGHGQRCGIGPGLGFRGRGQGRGAGIGGGRGAGGGGGGRGGGNKPGSGPAGNCVCPKCGHKEPHIAGQRCIDQNCPKCGTKMIRE